ncbi:MAG: flagellar basal body rod protein FlgC [Sphingobacteriia bacterium]|nr:flagellar basal body rod protein FlgC [Sphingobacteriia bacterium]
MEMSASGMKAQTKRMQVISQNIANSESTGLYPDQLPYRRKTIIFGLTKDKKKGMNLVKVRKIDVDKSNYKIRFDPDHPAANAQGYVLYPNVDKTVENMDAKEAQRSYEANLTSFEISKNMELKTLDILR